MFVGVALHLAGVGRHLRGARPRHRQRAAAARQRLLLRRVPVGDVDDLVAEHARELIFAVGQQQQPARHEHVAAGQRERIRLHLVDDRKLVAETARRQQFFERHLHEPHVEPHGVVERLDDIHFEAHDAPVPRHHVERRLIARANSAGDAPRSTGFSGQNP